MCRKTIVSPDALIGSATLANTDRQHVLVGYNFYKSKHPFRWATPYKLSRKWPIGKILVANSFLSRVSLLFCAVRYLVKAKVKSGKSRDLLESINNGSLGKGSMAGDEYIYNMNEARVDADGVATWVETCFCHPPLAEERPYWEQYFELTSVKDAHSRRNCRHENGTEPWACCDCDCTAKLEQRLALQGECFLNALRSSASRAE